MVRIKIQTHDLAGRQVGRIVDLETLDSTATLKEAIDYGYVTGKQPVLASVLEGVLKAMVDGVKKDGNGRKIDEFLSINAFLRGRLEDICDEINRKTAKVSLKARMLKEFAVDTSNWSFEIEGATGTFTLEVITTGEKVGEITLGQNVLINGKHLTMGEGDTVKYLVPETGLERTVSASYITSDETRITVARDGMQELFEPEMDGKTIVWIVKIGNKVARKSAVMHYVA